MLTPGIRSSTRASILPGADRAAKGRKRIISLRLVAQARPFGGVKRRA
ncbi:hypothetical protein F8B43_2434 [Methylorubrum populi]|uniref:Uncharacterized protein n=1 Tax=Methylorubrum populi TaxID=223967 RepID=A0A833J6F6_9HYPH|nr:hypothetical protein F8B43_2434 [Methylorubrum populi]